VVAHVVERNSRRIGLWRERGMSPSSPTAHASGYELKVEAKPGRARVARRIRRAGDVHQGLFDELLGLQIREQSRLEGEGRWVHTGGRFHSEERPSVQIERPIMYSAAWAQVGDPRAHQRHAQTPHNPQRD